VQVTISGHPEEPAARNNEVNVRMKKHIAAPGLKHAENGDLAADESGISGKLLRNRAPQRMACHKSALMLIGQASEFTRQGDGDEKVRDRQQWRLLGREPARGFVITTFGTMTILARVITVAIVVTIGAEINFTAKRWCAAACNITQRAPMTPEQVTRVSFLISLAARTKNVGQFEHGASS
jgi:hypothetical protein